MLNKPPYVSNGCPSLCDCTLLKYDYNANDAYDEYKALLSTSRSGISISEEDIQIIDVSLSPRVLQGQSIYAALLELKDTIMYSERTIYKLIDLNLLSIRILTYLVKLLIDLENRIQLNIKLIKDAGNEDHMITLKYM